MVANSVKQAVVADPTSTLQGNKIKMPATKIKTTTILENLGQTKVNGQVVKVLGIRTRK